MKRDRAAYILILPSLFTTGNLFCGFYSIVHSIQGDFFFAALLILGAGVFDALDGRVARMTKSQSRFGVEYDSISDVVSFALAPSLLSYLWALESYGRAGLAVAFFFAACGALRLARFNTIADDMPKSYFVGLPSPAAAIFIASLAIADRDVAFSRPDLVLFLSLSVLGLLMVSSVRYRSFKDFDLRHRRQFYTLVLVLIGMVFLIVKPDVGVCIVLLYYVLWGPVREAISWLRRSGGRKSEAEKLRAVEP
jgi:CDP-diacylglycerol---serine O-phosphatidyltransferase